MLRQDELPLRRCAAEENLRLSISFVQINGEDDGIGPPPWVAADPHIYAVPITGARSGEEAIVQGIAVIGIAWVGRATRTVNHHLARVYEAVYGIPEGIGNHTHT